MYPVEPPHPGPAPQRDTGSHRYLLELRRILPVLLSVVVGTALVLTVRPLVNYGWWTPDPGQRNPDEAGFAWRYRATTRPGPWAVVFSGDSSCATGVDPVVIQNVTSPTIHSLNLGLIIDLPLWVYADALQRAVDASNNSIQAAVLLISPQRIGHTVSGPYFEDLWLAQKRTEAKASPSEEGLAGYRELWRASALFRWVEPPLRGEGRLQYGFPSGIVHHLENHLGAFLDPGTFRPTRREEPQLLEPSPSTQQEATRFRQTWKRRVPLFVGIAPIPSSYAPSGYPDQRTRLMAWLQAAIEADRVLDTIPGVLPDALFASPTHLNAAGQWLYSKAMAEALQDLRTHPR